MIENITEESQILKHYHYYKGIHILQLSGSDYEIGFQHGRILKDYINNGILKFFSNYTEKVLKNDLNHYSSVVFNKVLYEAVGKKIYNNFPKYAKEALKGLADGSDINMKELIQAVVMPESFLWIISKVLKVKKFDFAPRLNVPLMGCSSVIAKGAATKDHSLLHGRNFDYQGVGYWDKQTAVIFHKPNNSQKYVSISTAGILFGGVTAMNESGLTLAVHQHLSSNLFDLGGLPIGIAGDQVMRKAENLEDAKKILDEHVPNGCWTYVITSAKENKTLCYEVTPSIRNSFISEDDTFGYTNIFLDKELAKSELLMYPSQWKSNTGRYHCINEKLHEYEKNIDENSIASILGEHGSNECRLRNPLAMLFNVSSVVFNPTLEKFYVASGLAPTCNREFIPFDFKTMSAIKDEKSLTGGIPEADALKAFDFYREAFENYFNKNDIDMARLKLAKAVQTKPQEPLYNYIAGLLALADKDASEAIKYLTTAIEIGHFDKEKEASFYLWRARAHDFGNNRELAIIDYNKALKGSDNAVYYAALKGIDKKWSWKKFGVEFNYADVVAV